MKIQYTVGLQPGQTPLEIDLGGPLFLHKLHWTADQAGLADPVIEEYTNVSPNAFGGNIAPGVSITTDYQAVYEHNGNKVRVDVRAVELGPVGVVAVLNAELGLGMSLESIKGMVYTPPAPPAPIEDWKVPGAPIGPPLPGQPGRFKSAYTGQPIGAIWTAPSGNRYKLISVGLAFLQYLMWEKQ